MDFQLPEELKMVQETIRRLVNEELIAFEDSVSDKEEIPPEILKRLEARVKELGFWAAAVPVEYGGGGLGVLGSTIIKEQVAHAILGDARDNRGFGGEPWPIVYNCNPDQRKRFLDPVVRGEKTHYFAMTEPDAGNDANAISTTAVQDGNEWVINGRKMFITAVDQADFGVVIAMTDKSKGSRGGLSAFLVEKDRPGFEVVRRTRTMGAAKVSELYFDNCRVPSENLLGEVGRGMDIAGKNLTRTRLRQAAHSLGLAQRALDASIEYAKQRSTFGKRTIDRGAVQMMLADSASELRAARLMVYTSAYRLDQGEESALEVAACKIFAAETGSRVLDRAIQIHGGSGYTRDLPFERMYRDQRGFRITEGGSEVQRWVIARGLMRNYDEKSHEPVTQPL